MYIVRDFQYDLLIKYKPKYVQLKVYNNLK